MAYPSISLDEYYVSPFQNQSNIYDPQKTFATSPSAQEMYYRSGGGQPIGQTYGGGYSSVSLSNTKRDVKSSVSTTTPIAPTTSMPTFGNVPAIDEARIKRLTQTRSAASQRALRTALRETLQNARYSDNPNVAALISRKALEGFGQGIASAITSAEQQATQEEYRDRQMQFAKQQAVFNAAMQNYMKRFGTTQTTNYDYFDAANSGKVEAVNSGLLPGPSSRTTNNPYGVSDYGYSRFLDIQEIERANRGL